MKEIWIHSQKEYPVLIGHQAIQKLNLEKIVTQECSKCLIITDTNVAKYHLEKIKSIFSQQGKEIFTYIMEAGEQSKNFQTYLKIIEFLGKEEFTRSDLLISLGGGVVTDLTGFVASTYLRGISYLQIPTSLLAMVDASIGGKTGINTSFGKNMVGSFYTPIGVICDLDFLQTLPLIEKSSGMAEVIKAGLIKSPKLWKLLQQSTEDDLLEEMIYETILVKKSLVEADEFDAGSRQLLNFGHTLGHAIEAKSHYQISHGQGVALGMSLILKMMAKKDSSLLELSKEVDETLRKFDLSTQLECPPSQLMEFIKQDKKRRGENISLILVDKIGNGFIQKMKISEVERWLKLIDMDC